MHPAAQAQSTAGVCDIEIIDFPVFLIPQENGGLCATSTVDARLGFSPVLVDDSRLFSSPRAFGPQLSCPLRPGLEQNCVARAKVFPINLIEGFPRSIG